MLFSQDFKDNRDVYRVFFKYLLWTFLFLSLIFMYIWQNIQVAGLEYKARKLEKELYVLKMKNKRLETEVSFLSSPERIGEIAVKRLGLVPVKDEDIIWIASNNEK